MKEIIDRLTFSVQIATMDLCCSLVCQHCLDNRPVAVRGFFGLGHAIGDDSREWMVDCDAKKIREIMCEMWAANAVLSQDSDGELRAVLKDNL